MSVGSSIAEGGFIGLSRESVGIDRRIYTNRNDTNPTLPVSYNAGRVEVYLNGIRLVGNHTEMGSTYDYTFTSTGSGSSIQLQTGIQLALTDVIECIGYVSNAANTVTTYNPSVSAGDNTFTGINHSSSDLLNVYLNGVLLDSSDYTASPGTASSNPNTVAITALALNDVVAIQVIQALAHNDFVPASGGTFSGDVAVTGDLTVDTNTLKVDSANNAVLVGQTSGYVGDSASASGFRVQADGFLDVAKSGTYVMRINRQSSQGEIISFRRDGASVGSIGAEGSDHLTIGTEDTGFLFSDGHNAIHPWNVSSNATRDNAIDLGRSSHRFKDLYLSNGVVFGTTGGNVTSKTLADYEEGTWTPSISGATLNANGTGFYIKVGNVVSIFAAFGNVTVSNVSGYSYVTGFPFTCNFQSVGHTAHNNMSTVSQFYIGSGSTSALATADNSTGTQNAWNAGSSKYMFFQATYRTT